MKDLASTALITICKPYGSQVLCAAYQVGDGAVCAYSKQHGITLMGVPDAGEYAGETQFLDDSRVTPDEVARRTSFALVDGLTALLAMTDGVSDPKFETASRLAAAANWQQLWDELKREAGIGSADDSEQKLLSWLDFWSTGNHDDRTIAIMHSHHGHQ